MMFAPMPLPADKQPYVKDVEGLDTRVTILWFTEGDSARRVGRVRRCG